MHRTYGLAAILRDARKSALLRMSRIYIHTLKSGARKRTAVAATIAGLDALTVSPPAPGPAPRRQVPATARARCPASDRPRAIPPRATADRDAGLMRCRAFGRSSEMPRR